MLARAVLLQHTDPVLSKATNWPPASGNLTFSAIRVARRAGSAGARQVGRFRNLDDCMQIGCEAARPLGALRRRQADLGGKALSASRQRRRRQHLRLESLPNHRATRGSRLIRQTPEGCEAWLRTGDRRHLALFGGSVCFWLRRQRLGSGFAREPCHGRKAATANY
jgi:hypothetical protein